jgi:Fe-S cluster assembly scaffold protein SufB
LLAGEVCEDQIFYLDQQGIGTKKALSLIVIGYCKEVPKQLLMEFAV